MTRKEKEITQLYLDTILEVAKDENSWLSFLKSASYNYKYRFDEQILIYAQRPDATAVAETTIWNKKLKRWINKGSKGIALIKEDNGEIGLRFVFDVSDTNSNVYGRNFKLWTAEEKYHNEILQTLEDKFGTMESKDNLAYGIMSTAFNYIAENIEDYFEELKEVAGDSKLASLDDKQLEETFLFMIMYSTVSMVMARCNIETDQFFEKSTLADVGKFNTLETINILGTATRDFSREILLEISRTVINLQKEEKNNNRTFDIKKIIDYDVKKENVKGSAENEYNLHNERELSNTRPNDTREQERRFWQIRNNEAELPENTQTRDLHDTTNEQQIDQTLDRDRQASKGQSTGDSGENERTTEDNRRIESTRPDRMGKTDEQYTPNSRADSSQRNNIHIEEQNNLKEAENASFFNDLKIIDILKNAPNVIKNREKIDNYINSFDININQLEENRNIEYFKNILGNAYTEFYYNNERVGYVANENGLVIWKGDYLHRTEETFKEWKQVVENFILEYDARIFDREIKTTVSNYNIENYHFKAGDIIYIGLKEFTIIEVDSEKMTIYDNEFPLYQETTAIKDIITKIAENPMNDYLKEERQQEVKEVNDVSFNKWLDTFIEEKGIDLEETFTIEGENNTHIFEIGNVIENIKATSPKEQAQIKDMIVKIDFNNGDVVDYFKHLARALAENFEQQFEKQEEQKQPQESIENEKLAKELTQRNKSRNIEYFDLHPEVPAEERNNYRIENDNLGIGSPREKFRNNIEAIKVLKLCEEQNRYASKEEQEILSKYVGWGGLKSAFEDDNSSWASEYNELKNLLTDEEYKNARASSLTAYYTPPVVIRNMYKALQNMGLKQANILEPSCRSR